MTKNINPMNSFEANDVQAEISYTITSDDTITNIANRYGVTIPDLMSKNPNLVFSYGADIGKTINIPLSNMMKFNKWKE